VITPRTTRLVRAADLRSFRSILAALATEGSPFDARNRLIVVPTRAAAHHLLRSIEDRLREPAATVLPEMVTRGELHDRLHSARHCREKRRRAMTEAAGHDDRNRPIERQLSGSVTTTVAS